MGLLSRARFAARSFRAAWAGSAGNYTERLLDEAQLDADGGGDRGAAAFEACAGLYERAFMQGRLAGEAVTPAMAEAVTPALLAQAGRALVEQGEWCAHVRARGNAWIISPACAWEVCAGGDSDDFRRWRYKLTIPTPNGSIDREVPRSAVAHIAIRGSASSPWWGRSAWQRAHNTARAAGQSEQRLREELSAHTGQVCLWPGVGTGDQIREIRRGLTQRQGGIAFVQHNRMADGAAFKIERVGAKVPDSLVALRSQTAELLAAAAGVPAALISSAGSTEVQAAIRCWLYTSLLPLGGLLSSELARCFGVAVELRFQRLAAADLLARANAARRLYEVTGSQREALDLAGFYE